MSDDPENDDCACGKSILEVSFAHYLSCGDDEVSLEWAEDFQRRVVARLERTLGEDPDA